MKKTETVGACALLYIMLLFALFTPFVSADKNAAKFMYENAEKSTRIAIDKLLVIDESGQDISELRILLNNALEKLTDSQLAYNNGDYDQALSLAREANELSIDAILISDALLQEVGFSDQNYDVQVAITIIKIVIISVIAYFSWNFLKNIYIKDMLKKKPILRKSEFQR